MSSRLAPAAEQNIYLNSHFRKILLFLDNAPVHPVDLKLTNVKLLFFPPNTTSKVQPLDQGVIRSFKAHYRSRLVKHIISSCTLAKTIAEVVITALDAIHWIDAAWKDVTDTTIRNTFRTAGFTQNQPSPTIGDDDAEMDEATINSAPLPVEDDPLKTLNDLLSHVKVDGVQLSASDFVNVDEETPVFNEWDDHTENRSTIEDPEQDQDDDEMAQEEPPSLADALEMIRKLHLLASTRQPELHQLVTDLGSKLTDAYIDSKTNKQSSITDFFQRT